MNTAYCWWRKRSSLEEEGNSLKATPWCMFICEQGQISKGALISGTVSHCHLATMGLDVRIFFMALLVIIILLRHQALSTATCVWIHLKITCFLWLQGPAVGHKVKSGLFWENTFFHAWKIQSCALCIRKSNLPVRVRQQLFSVRPGWPPRAHSGRALFRLCTETIGLCN